MLRLKISILLSVLSVFTSPLFAGGLSVEITNNVNSAYTANLSSRTTYENKPSYQVPMVKECDNGTLTINNLGKATTWCGYVGEPQYFDGGYAVINIKQINSNKIYASVIVTADRRQIAKDILYSEEARESTFHVHAACARLQNKDVCKISFDQQ